MYSSNARKLQIDNSNEIPVFKLIYTEIISKWSEVLYKSRYMLVLMWLAKTTDLFRSLSYSFQAAKLQSMMS